LILEPVSGVPQVTKSHH